MYVTWSDHFTETFQFDGLIVRLLRNARLLSCYSAGAQTHEAITFCRSKNLGLLLLFPLRHFLSNMAKNKRKRKLKEQDFQKVKLKVGKKLQPAQNTTDTSFKSRSVFIPNQLQKLDNEPTNQRNQTLKVRFSDCYYYLWTVISSIRQPISQNFIYTFNSILGWFTKWVRRGSP